MIEMFIPERLIDQAFDTATEVLASRVKKLPGGDKIARAIEGLHSEADFHKRFEKALQEAIERFVSEYRVQDEDLVGEIIDDKEFLESPAIQQAFVNILKRPDRYLEGEQEVIQRHFETIFPERLNRERVDRAISYFLKCLAESVWLMPEFHDIYSLMFQRMTAESARKQALVAETQMWLTQDVRDILLQITEAIGTGSVKRLPAESDQVLSLSEESALQKPSSPVYTTESPNRVRTDWDDAIDIDIFYGREEELDTIEQWVEVEKCRLIGVFGLGGIGKSALVMKLARKIEDQFDFIFWRTLLNAPPLEQILTECIQFLSNQREIDLPSGVGNLVTRLVEYMREWRCLIVLDNVEGILSEGTAGRYREGFGGYGYLVERLGSSEHRSCLLLTSREKPVEFALMEGETLPVRSFPLLGLTTSDGRQILEDKKLWGTESDIEELIDCYSGNPLALKIVADMIRTVYEGNIATFLQEGDPIFGDIKDLLEKTFSRLSILEQHIMFWFAVEREPISREDLHNNIVHRERKSEVMVALRSLLQRSLIEQSGPCFKPQNVVTEYVTNVLIHRVGREIETGSLELFRSHALTKAQAKDYVRQSQVRLILTPLADILLDFFRTKELIASRIMELLFPLRGASPLETGYAGGNALNLFVHLECDLSGFDFSQLTIWQAYLHGVNLHGVCFADSDLSHSSFTEAFAGILSVAFSDDGNILAAGSIDGNVYVWDVGSGRLRQILEAQSWVRSVAFNPDSTMLATANYDLTVRLWEVTTGRLVTSLVGHSTWVTSVNFSPDGKLLASGSEDQTVKIWDVEKAECEKTFNGHTGAVQSVKFSPDSGTVASSSSDQTIRLWNVRTGECIRILSGHTAPVWSVDFRLDGTMLASGGHDQTVRLWDTGTGRCVNVLEGHMGWVMSVAFNAEGDKLASGSTDQTVRLWDVSKAQTLKTLIGHTNWIYSVNFNLKRNIVASGSLDQTICFWDGDSGYRLRTLKGHYMEIKSVAFSPDGSLIASGGDDYVLRLWDVDKRQCIRSLRGHTRPIWSVAFSATGDIVASGSEDLTIRIWDAHTGECIRVLEGHESWIYVRFSHDGRLLASSGTDDETVRLWDTTTWKCLRILNTGSRVWGVAFTPDNAILASANYDKKVKLWDTSTGESLGTLEGHTDQVWSVDFSPNGCTLASAAEDQTIRLWDISTWACSKVLKGHRSWILTVVFSPDGSMLATEGNDDDTVRLWDAVTGNQIKILNTDKPWSIAFSPLGNMLASGSHDGTIKMWDIPIGRFIGSLEPRRLYEKMDITGVSGITEIQKTTLRILGAIDRSEVETRQFAKTQKKYNIGTISSLLRDAFTAEELRRFCRDQPILQRVLSHFSQTSSLEDMIDAVVEYCQKHLLLSELLGAVKDYNPRQYERYQVRLDDGD